MWVLAVRTVGFIIGSLISIPLFVLGASCCQLFAQFLLTMIELNQKMSAVGEKQSV